MNRRRNANTRRGFASILAIALLAVLATLAVSLASLTSLSARKGHNVADLHQAALLAESGMAFGARTIEGLQFPPGTTQAELLPLLAQALGERLNGTGNLAGTSVTYGTNWVAVPAIQTGDGAFQIRITQGGDGTLALMVTGVSGQARHAVAADINVLAEPPHSAFDYGIAAVGPIHLGGNAEIHGQNELTEASVMSITTDAVAVLIEGSAVIDGDISSAGENSSVIVTGNPTIAGSQDPAVIAQHIHFGVEAPVFPVVDTSIFKPLAGATVVDINTDTSQNGLVLDNPIIKANTNPTFSGDVVLNGVVYIEAPNIVNFAGKVTLKGLVATDDTDLGLESCKLTFAGQVEAYGVDALDPEDPKFTEVRALTGTFIAAPGFDVTFAGQFTTINGTIAADKLTFSGQAEGTVQGSVIGLANDGVSIQGTVNISVDRSGEQGSDAGFKMPVTVTLDEKTYREILLGDG